jgi:hypothetical protein
MTDPAGDVVGEALAAMNTHHLQGIAPIVGTQQTSGGGLALEQFPSLCGGEIGVVEIESEWTARKREPEMRPLRKSPR